MGDRMSDLPGGLLIPAVLTWDKLAVNTAAALTSDYQQASPRPGSALPGDSRSRLRPAISGSQSGDVDTYVTRAGMPSVSGGAEIAVKLDSEAAASWRGWNSPAWPTGWVTADSVGSSPRFDAVTIPSTQEIVLLYRDDSAQEATSKVIDSSDHSVGDPSASLLTEGDDWNYPAITLIPESERLYAVYGGDAYYSDDKGATWTRYAAGIVEESTVNFGRSRVAYFRGDLLLLVEDTGSSTNTHQYASSDLGASYTLVATLTSWGDSNSITVLPDAILVGCVDSGSSDVYVRRIASPFESLANASSVTVATGFLSPQVITAEPDGTVWCIYRDGVALPGDVNARWSGDGGASWSPGGKVWSSGVATDSLDEYACVAAMGGLVLLHNWLAGTAGDSDRIGACWLGGWHSVTQATSSPAITNRVGFERWWLPIELPQNLGTIWTLTGTSAALATNSGQRVAHISTSAATGYVTHSAAGGTHGAHVCLFKLDVESGGVLTGPQIGCRGQLADNTYDYAWDACFTTTGFRINDTNGGGTVIGTETVDMTTALIVLLYADNTGVIESYYWREGDTVATVGPSGTLTDDGAGTNADFIDWMHVDSGTAVSNWQMFHHATKIANRPNNGQTSVLGRPLSPLPVPVPALGNDPDVAWISATGGPGILAETHTIEAAYDYPISAAFASESPSPSSTWRSTDTSEQILAFDLGASLYVGQSVGLFIANANFATAYLESSTGAGWSTRATLDLTTGFSSLGSVRAGNTVSSSAGSGDGARYLLEGELRGGTIRHNTSGSAWSIVHNYQGGWTASASSEVLPQILLSGAADSSETDADSELVWPTGLVIVHDDSTLARYWRIRIPASQLVADSYYEAGVILAGRITPFGARVAWGRSDGMAPNAATTRDEAGTTRTTELGEPPRAWSLDWQDVTNATKMRESITPDYVGASAGLPLAADDEVLYQLWGLIQRLKSGEIPVVAIEEIPDSNGTITDRTRILYGRLVGSARGNMIGGDLGSSEQLRIEAIRIEEIV